MASDSTFSTREEALSNITCNKCGGKRHIAKDCRKTMDNKKPHTDSKKPGGNNNTNSKRPNNRGRRVRSTSPIATAIGANVMTSMITTAILME